MSLVKTNKIIYELEEEDHLLQKKQNVFHLKRTIIDRKLGMVTYIKWSTVYNYYFSFDTYKGRLICYKTKQSKKPNNYYSLIKGSFLTDEEEIGKKEQAYAKKKNYIKPPENAKSVFYVKTKKGKTFRLIIEENENADKIMGYLQMCFDSKSQIEATAFFALLGVGMIQVKNDQFKLATGIMVPLDDWRYSNQPQNYLQSTESGIKILSTNVPVIGGILGIFKQATLGIIFTPQSQAIDIMTFDEQQNPQKLYWSIFKLVKKQQTQKNKQLQFLKLNTELQIDESSLDIILIGENEEIKIFCRKDYLTEISHEEFNFQCEMNDEQVEDDINKIFVSHALEFYKKQTKVQVIPSPEKQYDASKEFIIAVKVGRIEQEQINVNDQEKVEDEEDEDEEEINENRIQNLRSIDVKLVKHKQFYQLNQSPNKSKSQDEPNLNQQQEIQFFEQKVEQQVENNNLLMEEKVQVQDQFKVQEQVQVQTSNKEIQLSLQQQEEFSIYSKQTFQCQIIHGQENILSYAKNFKFLRQNDEYRVEIAHKNGGTACLDKETIELSRSVGRTMIKEIGRKIISGNFNLTTISFPIKAMIPKSALEKSFMQTLLFPLYINRAAQLKDPIERMKLLMVATICNFIQANTFLKPLNPILGETFEGAYEDGSLLYGEQISHHPPISYFFMEGPNKSYKFYGFSLYEASAGLNSLVLTNKGKRCIEFQNQKISFNFIQEHYSGTFMGTLKHESAGTLTFQDERNNLIGTLNIGKVKRKPSDYIDGDIMFKNKSVAKLYGSYMGFLEFDGVRYWDAREVLPFNLLVLRSQLETDFSRRSDLIEMLQGNTKQAQLEKERLENIQRQDAKLRKQFESQKADKKKKK